MSAPQPPQNLACLRFSNPHVEHRILNFPRQTIVGLMLSYRHGIVGRTARLTFPSRVEFSEHPRGFEPVVDGHFRRALMSGKADGGASGITLISPEEPARRTCGAPAFGANAVLGACPARGPVQDWSVEEQSLPGLAHQGGEVTVAQAGWRQSAAAGSGASERTPKHDTAKIAHAPRQHFGCSRPRGGAPVSVRGPDSEAD